MARHEANKGPFAKVRESGLNGEGPVVGEEGPEGWNPGAAVELGADQRAQRPLHPRGKEDLFRFLDSFCAGDFPRDGDRQPAGTGSRRRRDHVAEEQ